MLAQAARRRATSASAIVRALAASGQLISTVTMSVGALRCIPAG
jgi:hypothetical protein